MLLNILLICIFLSIIYLADSISKNLVSINDTLIKISSDVDIFISNNSWDEGVSIDNNDGINENIQRREREFDERIDAIKEELGEQLSIFSNMTDAEVLENGIYNIPHHTIQVKEEMEIAD